jgi:hypothetical protein
MAQEKLEACVLQEGNEKENPGLSHNPLTG